MKISRFQRQCLLKMFHIDTARDLKFNSLAYKMLIHRIENSYIPNFLLSEFKTIIKILIKNGNQSIMESALRIKDELKLRL